jgi:FkbM family methyltransferase
MLIQPEFLNHLMKAKPNTILHIGAHLAEEADWYVSEGWGMRETIWIEAQQGLANYLKKTLNPKFNKIICCTAWSESGVDLNFYETNNGQSSSILPFSQHQVLYPNIFVERKISVQTKRIDEVIPNSFHPDFINIDVQGVELDVLHGCGELLTQTRYIYSEINKRELYQSCTLVKDLDKFLEQKHFKRIATKWYLNHGWGDALYVNTTFLRFPLIDPILLKIKYKGLNFILGLKKQIFHLKRKQFSKP